MCIIRTFKYWFYCVFLWSFPQKSFSLRVLKKKSPSSSTVLTLKDAFLRKISFPFFNVKILESSDNKKFSPLPFTEILILDESEIIRGLTFILWGAIGFKTQVFVFGLNIGPPLLRE